MCIVAQFFFVTWFYEIFQVQVYIRNMGKGFNNGGAFKAPVGAKTEWKIGSALIFWSRRRVLQLSEGWPGRQRLLPRAALPTLSMHQRIQFQFYLIFYFFSPCCVHSAFTKSHLQFSTIKVSLKAGSQFSWFSIFFIFRQLRQFPMKKLS